MYGIRYKMVVSFLTKAIKVRNLKIKLDLGLLYDLF